MATSDVPDNHQHEHQTIDEDHSEDRGTEQQIGHITFILKKGHLAKEKVNVIVNSTSGSLNLHSGAGSRALLSVAGETLQEECNKNYPSGIQEGEVAETGGGNLACMYVFHCFIRSWNVSDIARVRKIFCECVSTCLVKASTYLQSSVAFPALGAGFLDFPASEILQLMIKCVTEFSKNNTNSTLTDVRLIIYPKDENLFQDFLCEMRTFKNETSGSACTPRDITHPISNSEGLSKKLIVNNITVRVKQGSLVEQKADVLVNITNTHMNLSEGMMSKAVLMAAGPDIQKECYESFSNGIEHGQLAITSGYKLHCKAVYHSTLPMFKREESESHTQILYFLVQQCLMQADETQLKSIAMPVLGVGQPGYPYSVAANVIVDAIGEYCLNNGKSSITDVSLVVYTGGSAKNDWKRTWDAVCDELHKLKRRDDKASKTPDKADAEKRLVKLEKHHTADVEPLSVEKSVPSRGTKEWYKMKYEEEVRTPPYWTHFKGDHIVKKLRTSLTLDQRTKSNYVLRSVDKQTQDAIIKLVKRTWEIDKVGHGKDARGLDQLNFTKIRVTKVERIENLDIYEDYAEDRKKKFCKAWKKGNAMAKLGDVRGSSGEVQTTSMADQILQWDLYTEINEHYLFHGTKEDTVEKVLNQGLDSRMAGENAMFGYGVYGAESSTKADQYVDSKNRRTSSPKRMFLVRMCLGDICLCKKPVKYRKAPCLRCLNDDCDHKQYGDSVVGDGHWIFREFVVYKPSQCYPEFLITYVRE